ncbi:MAG: alpha/beta fold hydrolase [Gammaproteobacteria bacterium]
MKLPDYPFRPRRIQVRPGIAMSCLDEGPRDGETVLMLHGNPSWSYYWRHLVLGLRDDFRCIVPDHVGMGLSDKPDDAPDAAPRYDYTLASRIEDLDALLDALGVDGPLILAVHDWGGMIGLGWALRDPANLARVRRLVVLNTATFPLPAGKPLPAALRFGRDSALAALLIRGANAFAAAAARIGVARAMPPQVRRAYLAPYDSWAHRIATLRFVQDIPLAEGDRAWPLVEEAGRRLHAFADRPILIGWGLRDFVFDRRCLDVYRAAWPRAEVHAFEDADHYVLEDRHASLVPAIRRFLDREPMR